MFRHLFVAAFVAAAFVVPLCAEPPIAAPDTATALDQKILAAVKTKPEIIPNLTHLCDDIGSRLTGSASLKKANDWTAERMKAYGLENVHLEPYEIPIGWERGTVSAKIIEPEGGRPLLMASAGWSPGTKGKVEGDVVIFKATKREELAAYKGKLKNA